MEATRCGVAGCQRKTFERKPFCSNHLIELPHVRRILGVLERQVEDQARVREAGLPAVDTNDMTSREILAFLLDGPVTLRRLARHLGLDVSTARVYIAGMERDGLVRLEAGLVSVTPALSGDL